jgi:hypothetical protein
MQCITRQHSEALAWKKLHFSELGTAFAFEQTDISGSARGKNSDNIDWEKVEHVDAEKPWQKLSKTVACWRGRWRVRREWRRRRIKKMKEHEKLLPINH